MLLGCLVCVLGWLAVSVVDDYALAVEYRDSLRYTGTVTDSGQPVYEWQPTDPYSWARVYLRVRQIDV